jgi:trimethylamine--corrinoid protein Co-methyltransferase
MSRSGVLVEPYQRLSPEQIEQVHRASMEILTDPGMLCYNREAVELFGDHGAKVSSTEPGCWRLQIPESLILETLDSAPKTVKLGARDADNCLILDGQEPRVRFASGSESNNWLDVSVETLVSKHDPGREVDCPAFRREKGTVDRLATAAHLCEHLESWDSFLRPVNIQDDDINDDNKDVNKFFVSLNNTSKHVMAGLTELNQLGNVIHMAQLIAGGEAELRENPIISFITSVIKSPLQLVDDTTQKAIGIARSGLPLVISSAPQGGSTAPILEAGIVAQINAEILTGVCLTQLVNKGAPVIYGSVPGRANMSDLNDSYGVPEFSQYNIDCIQMARRYSLPCYSSGGVADGKIPGIQATVERLFSQTLVTLAGPQYLHYAFGLLERTNTFCPVQAVLDNAHIGMIKGLAKPPSFSESTVPEILEQTRRVMGSSHKLFVRFARSSLHAGTITPPYPFESSDTADETLIRATERMGELLALPPSRIERETIDRIFKKIPGLLTRLKIY